MGEETERGGAKSKEEGEDGGGRRRRRRKRRRGRGADPSSISATLFAGHSGKTQTGTGKKVLRQDGLDGPARGQIEKRILWICLLVFSVKKAGCFFLICPIGIFVALLRRMWEKGLLLYNPHPTANPRRSQVGTPNVVIRSRVGRGKGGVVCLVMRVGLGL